MGFNPRPGTRKLEHLPIYSGREEDFETWEMLFRAWCDRNRHISWVLITNDSLCFYTIHSKTSDPDTSCEYNYQLDVFHSLCKCCQLIVKL